MFNLTMPQYILYLMMINQWHILCSSCARISQKQPPFYKAASSSVQSNWFAHLMEPRRPQLAWADSRRSNVILGNLPSRVRAIVAYLQRGWQANATKNRTSAFLSPNCCCESATITDFYFPNRRHPEPIPANILLPYSPYSTLLISLTKEKTKPSVSPY